MHYCSLLPNDSALLFLLPIDRCIIVHFSPLIGALLFTTPHWWMHYCSLLPIDGFTIVHCSRLIGAFLFTTLHLWVHYCSLPSIYGCIIVHYSPLMCVQNSSLIGVQYSYDNIRSLGHQLTSLLLSNVPEICPWDITFTSA